MTGPIVAQYLDSHSFGGTERAALALLRNLPDRWQTVLLHHADAPADLRRAAADGGVRLMEVERPVDGFRGVPGCRAELRRLRPAVFHAQRAWPLDAEPWLLAARLAGVRAVMTTEQLFPDRLPRRGTLRERLLDPLLHVRIAVSAHVADRVRRTFGTPARRVRVVYNGIDPGPFEAARGDDVRRELGDDGRPLVLAVAHLRRQKGLETLIDAAAAVPGARFIVAGEGPERGALEARIAAAGLVDRCRLLGAREDIPQLLAACDVFVLPSRYEGLPLAVLEAMAARKPVIASRVGGVPEALADGQHGRLVAAGSAPDLAHAITGMLADPAGARRLADRAHARMVARFTARRMASEVSAIYDALLSSTLGSRP